MNTTEPESLGISREEGRVDSSKGRKEGLGFEVSASEQVECLEYVSYSAYGSVSAPVPARNKNSQGQT